MKITNKSLIKVILISLTITLISCITEKKFLELEGSNNNYGGKSVEAVNSSFAKTKNSKDVFLTNEAGYKSPTLLEALPLRRPIETGGPENADAVLGDSQGVYYDGNLGITNTVSFCQQYETKPQACVHQGNCGWCMGKGSCVSGTPNGPVNEADCVRGQYLFEAPNADWNPLTIKNTKTVRTNVMGAQLTTIVQQP